MEKAAGFTALAMLAEVAMKDGEVTDREVAVLAGATGLYLWSRANK